MVMRPAGEPRFDLGCLVGCVVIHDDMDIEPFRDFGIDLFEELQELDGPVTLVAFADDKPRGDTFGESWCGKSQFPPPSSGSTSASRQPASCVTSARSRQQPDRR